ncbi:diguanylate cyclase, partial [Burkholderia multivorans]
LVALLFEIDLTVLALMAAGFVLHEFTALADVRYAVSRRDVSPFEQHVHSFLEMMPLVALSLIAWIVLPARLR